MNSYSILDQSSAQAASKTASTSIFLPSLGPQQEVVVATAIASETLRFPGEDGGKSLSEMAQRDLDATLQLLAERAQYITGASGAAIGLRQEKTMVCCASAGSSAPEVGAHLEIESGLSAESVKTGQILHCDDAETDPRVNRESCRAFGIASVMVMPLVRGEEVYGVFELMAARPYAFEERDFVALQRLAEMIQTAVGHADAARRAEKDFGGKQGPAILAGAKAEPETVQPAAKVATGDSEAVLDEQTAAPETKTELEAVSKSDSEPEPKLGFANNPAMPEIAEARLEAADKPLLSGPIEFGNVGTCEACAFPVSWGRRLCLDCEAATTNPTPGGGTPETESTDSHPTWARSHVYLIAALLIAAATIAVVVWRL